MLVGRYVPSAKRTLVAVLAVKSYVLILRFCCGCSYSMLPHVCKICSDCGGSGLSDLTFNSIVGCSPPLLGNWCLSRSWVHFIWLSLSHSFMLTSACLSENSMVDHLVSSESNYGSILSLTITTSWTSVDCWLLVAGSLTQSVINE